METDGRGLDTPAAKAEFFLSLVEDQRAVLLLDDVRTAAQVTPFLTGASGLLVIVTAAGPVQRLARYRPRSLALKRMADTDLAALITGVLQDDDRCADTGAVTELAGHCLGLPLVARHAAGLLAARPDIPVRGLARRMAEHGRLGALEDGQGEAMPVPDDPSGVFEAHYRELDPRAAELYLGLGLHPTPDFDRWCGHAILHGHPRDEADAALRTLLARGLVQQGRPGRYAMHDLAHEHAARTAQRELPRHGAGGSPGGSPTTTSTPRSPPTGGSPSAGGSARSTRRRRPTGCPTSPRPTPRSGSATPWTRSRPVWRTRPASATRTPGTAGRWARRPTPTSPRTAAPTSAPPSWPWPSRTRSGAKSTTPWPASGRSRAR
ncbi:hypothetical protein ACFQXA_26385 [Nocardiopsis composta]